MTTVFAMALALLMAQPTVRVIDGDTVVINGERIRLAAIDAPELHRCPKNRHCVPGDGPASKRSLEGMMHGRITIERWGTDRWGRTVANVRVNGRSLSCAQIAAGQAVLWPRYDKGGRLARECGLK